MSNSTSFSYTSSNGRSWTVDDGDNKYVGHAYEDNYSENTQLSLVNAKDTWWAKNIENIKQKSAKYIEDNYSMIKTNLLHPDDYNTKFYFFFNKVTLETYRNASLGATWDRIQIWQIAGDSALTTYDINFWQYRGNSVGIYAKGVNISSVAGDSITTLADGAKYPELAYWGMK